MVDGVMLSENQMGLRDKMVWASRRKLNKMVEGDVAGGNLNEGSEAKRTGH